jgi:cell shape-determining protein MreC
VGTVVSFKLDLSENYIEIEVLLSADLRNLDNVYILNNNNFDEIISLYE